MSAQRGRGRGRCRGRGRGRGNPSVVDFNIHIVDEINDSGESDEGSVNTDEDDDSSFASEAT